jgi:hypothetical protein
MEEFLIFINYVGVGWDGQHIYDFIFSTDYENIDAEGWDNYPAAGSPELPPEHLISSVIRIETKIKFDLVADSELFAYWDAVDGVIAIAWENTDNYEVYPEKRLFFSFGHKKSVVNTIFIEKEIKITTVLNSNHETN